MPAMRTSPLLLLQTWFSPAFPVGSFGYSHGLEQAIADGRVTTPAALEGWIAALLSHGGPWTDAVLFAAAHQADAPQDIADLAEALAPSRERHAETMGQGNAFLAALAAWPEFRAALAQAPYPVATGSACALAGIPLTDALFAYLNAFASQLISVAVRTVPIGQSQGLAVLSRLHPLIAATANRAAASSLDDLGACALVSDIAAMRHETLQPRLFLS